MRKRETDEVLQTLRETFLPNVLLQSAAVLDECRDDLPKAIALARAAINIRERDDNEFNFRCMVCAVLENLPKGAFEC